MLLRVAPSFIFYAFQSRRKRDFTSLIEALTAPASDHVIY